MSFIVKLKYVSVMKKFIVNAYRVLAVLSVILSILFIVRGDDVLASTGVSLFLGGFFLWGFSYIVEAACLFIEKYNKVA